MNKIRLLIGVLSALIAPTLLAASADTTTSSYILSNQKLSGPTILLKSEDGVNASPINAAHPLPVTMGSAPAGGATATNQTVTQAPVAPATATATKSMLVGCQYASGGVTFTDGQQGRISCGPNGGLFVSGTIASGSTDSGSPVKTGGVYNSTPPTFTTGQRGDSQIDAKGSLKVIGVDGNGAVVNPTLPVQIYQSNSYANITTATSTQIKSAAGTLTGIVVNKSGTTDILTIYDNTACSGTKIGTATVTAASSYTLAYNLAFNVGLCITSGGTAGDYTVTYR